MKKLLSLFPLVLMVVFGLLTTTMAYSPPPGGRPYIQAKIQIDLPPKIIAVPEFLRFPENDLDSTYAFNPATLEFTPQGTPRPPSNNYRIVVTKIGADNPTQYYRITITKFKLDDLPNIKDFKLTFKKPVKNQDINDLETYLKTNSAGKTAFFANSSCAAVAAESAPYICLKTITSVRVFGKKLNDATLEQLIAIKGITIQGNVAAPQGSLENYSIGKNALAVGDSVINITGENITKLDNFNFPEEESVSKIKWSNIGEQITASFRAVQNVNKSFANIYTDESWNLNSIERLNPRNPITNSFSTPPEGRLWNIYVDPIASGGSYRFGPGGNKSINISGSGTLAIRSTLKTGDNYNPMKVVFPGKITCSPGTRFSIVTEGDIVFETPTNKNIEIGCGSYTSLGGSITFGNGNVEKGALKGIFTAKNNVLLPNPNELKSLFQIQPDLSVLSDPPVLMRELFKILFKTQS